MNVTQLAEGMDGLGVNWLIQQAKTYATHVAASLIIKTSAGIFNRMIVANADGIVATYDKRKLFGLANEDDHYTAGKENTIFQLKGWNILLQICYDLRFPEQCRNTLVNGNPSYDMLLYVANWPERRSEHWKTLLKARAIENQSYVIGVNRVGKDDNMLIYSGDTMLINALGEILTHKTHEEVVVIKTLSHEDLKQTREKLPFLKDMG
jgi:predicted amidohydrolase